MNEKDLLRDPDVKRWYLNLQEGSIRTSEVYLYWLNDYCAGRNTTPKDLVEEFQKDKKKAQDELEDYIRQLRQRKSPFYAGSATPKTVSLALTAIKNWFRRNEMLLTRQIKVGNLRSRPTIEHESPPSPEELRTILIRAPERTRASISLIAFAGIRPEAVSKLTLADLPEFEASDHIKALREPMRINVRAEISKNKRPYFTFLIKEGVDYLVRYLESRVAEGEKLTPKSPVIAVSSAEMTGMLKEKGVSKKQGEPIQRMAITQMIRRVMRRSGTSVSRFRPYVLRSYFDSQIQKKLPHNWEQFFMGHAGSIEADYTVRKHLREEQIEEMRTAFKEKAEPELTTAPQIARPDARETFITAIMLDRKCSRQEAEKAVKLLEETKRANGEPIDYNLMTIDEVTETMIKERVEKGARKKVEDDPQLIVQEPDLEIYLKDGWQFVSVLQSGRVVIRR